MLFGTGAWVSPSPAQIPISEAREEGSGATVTVEGTVTRAFGDFVRFQDESGPTGASGLVVRQTSGDFQDDVADSTIVRGTELQVTGTLSEFNGLLQINEGDLDDYTVQGEGSVPDPQRVELATIRSSGEQYESELVRVTGVHFLGQQGRFTTDTSYPVTDGSGEATFAEGVVTFRVQGSGETNVADEPIPPGRVEYTGVVGEFSGQYQLIPVQPSDVRPVRSVGFTRQFAQAAEGTGTVEVNLKAFATESGDEVSVTASVGDASTAAASDVSGFDGSQTFTFSGSDPAAKTLSLDPLDDGTTEGVERLEIVLQSDDGPLARPSRFTLWILDEPDVQMTIAEGDSGNALLDALQEQFGDPRPLGDDFARDSMYAVVYSEPADTVEGQYSGFRIEVDPTEGDPSAIAEDKGINTEHMWPQSQGAGDEPATSDMHILAPARDVVNSARSNAPYGEIPDADTDTWYIEDRSQSTPPPESERPAWSEVLDSERFEPRHSVKGDVARAALYFVTIYPNRASLSFWEDQRETLLQWHREDPVDATEMRRNLIQASYQNNVANPYVLDSTLADRAFGSGDGEPGGGLVSIQEAREQGAGAVVEVEGTVTRAFGAYARIQDDSGPEGASGLTIRQTSGSNADAFQQDIEDGSIQPGTRVRVRGNLSAFNGLLQLNGGDLVEYEILGQGDPPAPQSVTLADLEGPDGEGFESVLVRLNDLSFPEASGTFRDGTTYTVENADGTAFEFRVQNENESALIGTSIPGGTFDFEGVVGQFNGAGFVDPPDEGYQLLGIEESDLKNVEEGLPSETTFDVTRSFGDPSSGDSYRLVALPGQVDSSLAATLDGENGLDWQAYWDDGSSEDYFIRFNGTDTFAFRPGRGFWLLGTGDWGVEATVPTVSVTDGAATIPLHDGWNIVSNPLPRDVAWSDVRAANGGTLDPLWGWTGDAFEQSSTFVSARSGQAFYFLNDEELDELSIPVSGSSSRVPKTAQSGERERAVALAARTRDGAAARVRVAEHTRASDGQDRRDWIAPPSQFADLSLTVEAPFEDAAARQTRLARDVRAAGGTGHTYTLVLRADTTGPVTLRAASLPQSDRTHAVLLHPETGERHDLRADGPMTVAAGAEPTRMQLLVGTASYVEAEAREQVPETLTVQPPAPNPFRDQTTFRYALPEAQKVRVAVYDLLGRQVQTLVDGRRDAGGHRVTWNGQDGAQRRLASGTYLVRWSTDSAQHVEKVVLIR